MSHDRGGVATKTETHRAARWQGAGRGGRGAEPPRGMVKARYHRSAGLLRLPRPLLSSSMPLASTPLPTPPASVAAALGLGLGRGSSGSVGASSAGAASSWTWPSMGATSPTVGGRLRVSGIVAQPQGMGALAVESRALVTVVRRKRAGLT